MSGNIVDAYHRGLLDLQESMSNLEIKIQNYNSLFGHMKSQQEFDRKLQWPQSRWFYPDGHGSEHVGRGGCSGHAELSGSIKGKGKTRVIEEVDDKEEEEEEDLGEYDSDEWTQVTFKNLAFVFKLVFMFLLNLCVL